MKLYRSTRYHSNWFAFSPTLGWVIFPAETNGWQKRLPAPVIDLTDMHEIPLRMGFNTGIPGAPESGGCAAQLRRKAA